MNHQYTPHYKTLDIIEFYNQVYDFVSRYLIFVIAGVLSFISIIVIWIREPESKIIVSPIEKQQEKGFIQETGLIYPVNYFAQQSISFDGDNKIYGLGGPIWRHQGMWNSIDNIVQYNGVILPRQISRSARVPPLQQSYYTDSMIKTFLEGIGNSQVDISTITSSIVSVQKRHLSKSLIDTFGIGCIKRSLFTTKFCNLKLLDAFSLRDAYDLSGSLEDLTTIHHYLNHISNDRSLTEAWCTMLIKQYRYSANYEMAKLASSCSKDITDEIDYITDMTIINKEVISNKYTNVIYANPIMNWYKLISWYQYFMTRIKNNEFVEGQDDVILEMYNSYITKLANSNIITQPYGDIITIFHEQYLHPRLDSRDAFASSKEKEVTKKLKDTTALILQGNTSQGIVSILSGSRIRSRDFIISEGLQEDIITGSSLADTSMTNSTAPTQEETNITTGSLSVTNGGSLTPQTISSGTMASSSGSAIESLIASVLGSKPLSILQRGQTIIIKYEYKSHYWFISIDLTNKGVAQIYYDSPLSGATKITHTQVIFTTTYSQTINTIMDTYLSQNPQ